MSHQHVHACMQVGSTCVSAVGTHASCETPSNEHGANDFDRSTGMLEVMLTGHEIDQYVDIQVDLNVHIMYVFVCMYLHVWVSMYESI